MRGPTREEFGEVTRWLKIQIERLGVEIQADTEVTLEMVGANNFDAVVVATGASAVKPMHIQGAERENVITTWDVLGETASVGETVIVYSEWAEQAALSAAEFLANKGKHVEIVTPMLFVGQDIDMISVAPMYERLLAQGVICAPQSTVVQIEDGAVTIVNIYSHQAHVREGVDTVVLSTPAKANDEMYFALKDNVSELYRVGDCVAPRKVDAAIHDGEMVGRAL
jgi:pyruvate/2-oxoglutarate dehydrogenase complex dihydrolipoamide dehydrogenase (E3) component